MAVAGPHQTSQAAVTRAGTLRGEAPAVKLLHQSTCSPHTPTWRYAHSDSSQKDPHEDTVDPGSICHI